MVAQVRSADEWKSEFTANGSTKVEWLVGENPKRPSGQSYARFANYFQSQTVEQYLARGGTKADLRYDWEKGFLDLQLPATETVAGGGIADSRAIELLGLGLPNPVDWEQDPLTIVEDALPMLETGAAESDFAAWATGGSLQVVETPTVVNPDTVVEIDGPKPSRKSRKTAA